MTALDLLEPLQGFPQQLADALPCHIVDPELFFSDNLSDIAFAKALCLDCPLRAECLAGALERSEPHGVWGGELLADGEIVARKRPRGRPRKNPLPEPSPLDAQVPAELRPSPFWAA